MSEGGSISAMICSEDVDTFTFSRVIGPLAVTVDVAEPASGLSVALIDGAETVVAEGPSLDVRDVAAGTYYLRFHSHSSESSFNYQATVSVDFAGCPVDLFERNDTASAGAPLAPEAQGLAEAYLCADDDYFRVILTGAEQWLHAMLTHDGTLYPVLVQIINPDLSPPYDVLAQTESVLPSNEIWVPAPGIGTYYVRVHHSVPGGDPYPEHGLRYDLSAAAETSPCSDDSFEPNDTVTDASGKIPAEGLSQVVLCPADDDWFQVPVTADDLDLYIGIESSSTIGFSLQLFDATGTMLLYGCPNPTCNGALSRLECSGTQVADSTGSSPLSWLVPRLEAGDYLAHVETSGEVPIDGVPYTLTYRVLDDCSL
jgi:hypothetical protein